MKLISISFRVRKVLLIMLLAFCCVQLFTPLAMGVEDFSAVEEELERGQTSAPEQNNLWWEFIKLVFFLLLLIAASAWVIRYLNSSARARSQGVFVHIVDEVVLGQNRGIALCEVGGRLYGLGITEHQINLLFETDNPKLLEQISQEPLPETPVQTSPLVKLLNQALSNRGWRSGRKPQFSQLMSEQASRLQDMIDQNAEKGPK